MARSRVWRTLLRATVLAGCCDATERAAFRSPPALAAAVFLPALLLVAAMALAGAASARVEAAPEERERGRAAESPARGFTPAVEAFTIRAVAALAAAFLEAERFAAPSEEAALTTLEEVFVFTETLDLAAVALALLLLEVFCANAQSACAAPPSNTAPSNSLDIQFTAPISAKTSHSRDGF